MNFTCTQYMNALDTLKKAKKFLESSGIEDGGREAELILSHCLGIDRVVLYKDNPQIPEDIIPMIDECIIRKSKREPLQYIIGYTEFHGLKIKVGPGVLIPRPETEVLAEEAIKTISNFESRISNFRILDLCTGSGCLALSLAKEFPDAMVYGIDTSEIALRYAKENAEINRTHNVTFLRGNLFEPVKNSNLAFDVIVSNPPYIKKDDIKHLQPEIKDWEPIEALDGGEDGLDYYRTIIAEAGNYLKDSGVLMVEIGINQADTVKKLAINVGLQTISLIKDYAGIERILITKKE